MRIAVAGDHNGYTLRGEMASHLIAAGHEVLDFGAQSFDPDDDYPDFAGAVSKLVCTGRVKRGM